MSDLFDGSIDGLNRPNNSNNLEVSTAYTVHSCSWRHVLNNDHLPAMTGHGGHGSVITSSYEVGSPIININTSKLVIKPKKVIIEISVRPWAEVDYRYWYSNYGINKILLDHCGVRPISFYRVNGVMYKADELAYAELFENEDCSETGKKKKKVYH